jgi:hypothetical protein
MWFAILQWAGILFAFAAIGVNLYQLRRLRRQIATYQFLNRLLLHMAVQAFADRHLPIWIPWAAFTNSEIEIVVTRKGPPQER